MINSSFATATMQTPQLPPWDLYAEMLYPLRYGYPLWDPTIECGDGQKAARNSWVGMVGFVENGKFRPLLRSGAGEGSESDAVPTPLEELRDRFSPHINIYMDSNPAGNIAS